MTTAAEAMRRTTAVFVVTCNHDLLDHKVETMKVLLVDCPFEQAVREFADEERGVVAVIEAEHIDATLAALLRAAK